MRRFPKFDKIVDIDVGCGKSKLQGYIGLDAIDYGQDILWDVRDGLPFPDSSLDSVFSCHFLEHLTDDEALAFLHEVFRVLKVGGKTGHRLPHLGADTAFLIGHKSLWNTLRIKNIPRIVGLETLKVMRNERLGMELLFDLIKT